MKRSADSRSAGRSPTTEDARDLDPQLREALGDPGAVAITDAAVQDLGAGDDDACPHAHRGRLAHVQSGRLPSGRTPHPLRRHPVADRARRVLDLERLAVDLRGRRRRCRTRGRTCRSGTGPPAVPGGEDLAVRPPGCRRRRSRRPRPRLSAVSRIDTPLRLLLPARLLLPLPCCAVPPPAWPWDSGSSSPSPAVRPSTSSTATRTAADKAADDPGAECAARRPPVPAGAAAAAGSRRRRPRPPGPPGGGGSRRRAALRRGRGRARRCG